MATDREAEISQHELCKGEEGCAYLQAPDLNPLDRFYHMDFEHCRLCAIFWDQRDRNPCIPKYGLRE